MLFPAKTFGVGDPKLVTLTSACPFTLVVAVALLLPGVGSVVVAPMVAVSVITVLPFAELLTLTTRVNGAVPALASDALVAVTVPVPPTAGVDGVQPAGALNETKVVLAGTASLSVTLAASLGPLFATLIV